MFVNAGNNFKSRLAVGLNATFDVLFLDGDDGLPDFPFLLTINNNRENMEIVKVTGIDPITTIGLIIERGQEGTTAQSHEAGSIVENNFTAGTYQALVDEIKALKQQSGIAEMGENSNGQYIRYENGIQLCWHEVYNDDTTTSSGSLYQKIINFNFPKPFTDIPSVAGTVRNDTANYVQWTTVRQVSTNELSIYAVCTSQDRPGFYGYQAIGRWK